MTWHKAGISAVFNIAFEREGKKWSCYNTGYSYLVTHPGTHPNEHELCWARVVQGYSRDARLADFIFRETWILFQEIILRDPWSEGFAWNVKNLNY